MLLDGRIGSGLVLELAGGLLASCSSSDSGSAKYRSSQESDHISPIQVSLIPQPLLPEGEGGHVHARTYSPPLPPGAGGQGGEGKPLRLRPGHTLAVTCTKR